MGALQSRNAAAAAQETEVDVEAQNTAACARGLYYGPPFVIGGNNFAAANPNGLLFSNIAPDFALNADFALNRLGQPTPDNYTTSTIRCHVNLKKSSLKLTRRGGPESTLYHIAFAVDADLPCRISVYVAATEHHDTNQNIYFRSKNTTKPPPSAIFPKGYNQMFSLADDQLIDLGRYKPEDLDMNHEKHVRGVYPLVILIEAFPQTDAKDSAVAAAPAPDSKPTAPEPPLEGSPELAKAPAVATAAAGVQQTDSAAPVPAAVAVPPSKFIQSQSSFYTLVNASGGYEGKPVAQKIMVEGLPYFLQEIYGIEHATDPQESHDDYLENTRECVVCLSDLKDTAVLPCRHMCLCSQCAEQLRHQSNRCPICRQPFHSLLQIKIGEDPPVPAINVVGGNGRGTRPGDTAASQRGRSGRVGVIPAFPVSTYTPLNPFDRPITISTRIPYPVAPRSAPSTNSDPPRTATGATTAAAAAPPASSVAVVTTGVVDHPLVQTTPSAAPEAVPVAADRAEIEVAASGHAPEPIPEVSIPEPAPVDDVPDATNGDEVTAAAAAAVDLPSAGAQPDVAEADVDDDGVGAAAAAASASASASASTPGPAKKTKKTKKAGKSSTKKRLASMQSSDALLPNPDAAADKDQSL